MSWNPSRLVHHRDSLQLLMKKFPGMSSNWGPGMSSPRNNQTNQGSPGKWSLLNTSKVTPVQIFYLFGGCKLAVGFREGSFFAQLMRAPNSYCPTALVCCLAKTPIYSCASNMDPFKVKLVHNKQRGIFQCLISLMCNTHVAMESLWKRRNFKQGHDRFQWITGKMCINNFGLWSLRNWTTKKKKKHSTSHLKILGT